MRSDVHRKVFMRRIPVFGHGREEVTYGGQILKIIDCTLCTCRQQLITVQYGDQMKEVDMDEICSMHERKKNTDRFTRTG